VLDRLLGTETEYAIRFRPADGVTHPGNEVLFEAIRAAVADLVHTRPGQGIADTVRRRVFTENGGSLYYEFVPRAQEGGLVEAGTPECRGPGQLVLYVRAQDRLLAEAVKRAEDALRARGLQGELALLKNCRDAVGHVYGAQESYEVDVARGPMLWIWRLSVLLALPFAVVAGLVHWGMLLGMLVVALPTGGLVLCAVVLLVLLGRTHPDDAERYADRWGRVFDVLGMVEVAVAHVVLTPPTFVAAAGLHLAGFRPYRQQAMAFLVSRCVLSGAGTLEDDGCFTLSEKAGGIRRVMRWTVRSGDRGLIEIGHLVKPLHAVGWFDWRGVARLFHRRQRLQLGLSDSNLCQVAEFLKIGSTALVLDLVDAGRLTDAPVPVDPIRGLQFLASDPDLTAEIPLVGGGRATALGLQRYYLERAEEWLRESPAVSLEARRVVDLWRCTLDDLSRHPASLVGQLDWVTKRQLLLETEGLEQDARKKVDLRYHELGTGYHAWLDEAGASVRLVGDEEADRARREPPPDSPAADRGALVRELAGADTEARIGWDHARVGGTMGARIIRFDTSRRKKPPD
jgi:Pup amidohydrolase